MLIINSGLLNNNVYRCNRTQPNFGMRVSKLGRQIDEVLATKGSDTGSVDKLRGMLKDYFSTSKTMLGMGFQEKVFAVDDKYVIKSQSAQFCDSGKISFDTGDKVLTGLKSYFGGVLMRIGNLKILRNVSSDGKHIPAGIPVRMIGQYPADDLEYYYNNIYLPLFANLPQRSFDRIAKDFACLNSKGGTMYGLQFDINNSNNIVLAGTSTLRIIDDINEVQMSEPNRVTALLDMFLKKANASMLAPEQTPQTKPLRLQIFKKLILAGEKYELPLTFDTVYDKKVWEMVCKFGTTGDETLADISSMRKNIKDKKRRLQCVASYLEKLGV